VLAIGIVVDDAIVVVEAVQVKIEAGMDPKEATTVHAMEGGHCTHGCHDPGAHCRVSLPVAAMAGITGLLVPAVRHHGGCICCLLIGQCT
jgi:HAE1 family hydrophobic/amphiphilic exporter-1